MDRRTFGASLVGGALALSATPALAQSRRRPMAGMNMEMGAAENRHARDTLEIGSASLATSRLAQSRGGHPLVRQFAQFEIEESTTLAQIIGELSGMAPPPPAPTNRRVLEQLQAARGADFDRLFITGQIDAHRRAREVQDRYLGQGRNTHHRHIAMLSRGRILEHIRELELIRDLRS